MFLEFYNNVKAWFKHSETVLIERSTALAGFIIAVVGGMDWSPFFSIFGTGTAFNQAELYVIGGGMFVKGLFGEWARRRNTIEVDSKLIPTSIVKEVKTEVVTNLPDTTTTTTNTVTK